VCSSDLEEVRDKAVSAADLLRAWTAAADIFGLPVNRFAPGDPADFSLFDPDAAWEVTPESLRSRGKNTPLLGATLQGRVVAAFVSGRRII
jgi:dihydroorotase